MRRALLCATAPLAVSLACVAALHAQSAPPTAASQPRVHLSPGAGFGLAEGLAADAGASADVRLGRRSELVVGAEHWTFGLICADDGLPAPRPVSCGGSGWNVFAGGNYRPFSGWFSPFAGLMLGLYVGDRVNAAARVGADLVARSAVGIRFEARLVAVSGRQGRDDGHGFGAALRFAVR
ncbi:MAG: hypothetical protein IRZ00_02835 [Gemmatimonadetes bacterium]|nr:hypothetical protein [Gemmatimonadota bacterium]